MLNVLPSSLTSVLPHNINMDNHKILTASKGGANQNQLTSGTLISPDVEITESKLGELTDESLRLKQGTQIAKLVEQKQMA